MARRAIWTGSLVWLAGAAACGRIGYLPEDLAMRDAATGQGPSDAHVSVNVESGNDATAVSDAAMGLDSTASMFETSAMDSATPVETGVDDSPAGDTATGPLDAGPVEAEAAPPPLDCGATCCCAYTCVYGAAPAASGCGSSNDTAQYGFESATQGWVLIDTTQTLIPGATASSTAETFAGGASLAVTLNVPAASNAYAEYSAPNLAPLAGATVAFHVWLPANATLLAIQPYVMDANYVWTGSYVELGQLAPGCWSTIKVVVPATFVAPAFQIGVQFITASTAGYGGVAYVDAVEW